MNKIILCDSKNTHLTATLCKKYNFGIELQSFYEPSYFLNPNLDFDFLPIIEEINLRGMHAPFIDLSAGSLDPMIQEVSLLRYNQAYDFALRCKVNHLIIHHAYVPNTKSCKDWTKRFFSFWEKFSEKKDNSIFYHLENVYEADPYILIDSIDAINRNNVDICLDIGHANCFSKTKPLDWIKILNNKIGYFHLHNNWGISDEHLDFYSGTVNFKEIFEAILNYSPNAILAIETRTEYIEKSIEYLMKNFIY